MTQGVRGERRRIEGLARALGLLQALLRALGGAGWPPRRVHLLGFSQGGTVALELARRWEGPEGLGSCIAISAALLPESLLAEEEAEAGGAAAAAAGGGGPAPRAAPAPDGTPVLITRGTADTVLPRGEVLHTAEALRARHGLAVEVEEVAGKGHAMVAGTTETRALMALWARRLAARPAASGGLRGERESAAGGCASAHHHHVLPLPSKAALPLFCTAPLSA